MAASVKRWRSVVRSTSLSYPLTLRRNFSASSNGKRAPPFTEAEAKPGAKEAEAEVPSSSSLLEEVRASLRRSSFTRTSPSLPPSPPPSASVDEIRKNPSEFRSKSATPPGDGSKERLSFEAIRDSLRQLRSSGPEKPKVNESAGSFSLKAFGESLKLQPSSSPLPLARDPPRPSKTDFMKMYSYDELGARLRELRSPSEKGFSISELNNRLQKLREMEEKESESNIGGISFKDLRESLAQLRKSSELSNKKSSLQRLALLGQLGGKPTPSYMTAPAKDELVQRYFHPDNMSAEEKLKIELKKVKEDFKIHESDCGSSRVQVAQLTTKIKYLAQVLHKKDKHSRKGLNEMIQRRKKLLKYLRRTDWDSYCFVISKLGLRDNPDYKT
ncbi:hypothetical protein SUGI_0619610 [Cryptomeria japonica]|uniref:uncharacterized protein LOC131077921 n=1 Tax=Cryptomeria japonica TaxID=3369 RepID=UPI0024147B62|nr:uncharacterized protein LOC131077921 [Cryptomeria japonica]GLJ31000.1 hypothetical protein SUGI_0619610 [Cryptomeria japonica]